MSSNILSQIVKETILDEYYKSLKNIYCFTCSINYHEMVKESKSLMVNCKGARTEKLCKSVESGNKMFVYLHNMDYAMLIDYLNKLLKKKILGHGLSEQSKENLIAQLKRKLDYSYDNRRKVPLYKKDNTPFKSFKVKFEIENISPDDIPNISSKEKKNAKFFTSLYYLFYHLEVSLRNYLRKRLKAIYGASWEMTIKNSNLIPHAFALKKTVTLSECFPNRGDDLLNYCNWVDYPILIKSDDKIWDRNKEEKDEFCSHLNSMYKIRNAIAHNAETIPKEIIQEMEVFIKKYIRIFKQN